MPRRIRLVFPRLPHHVIQRGHSRHAAFFSDAHRVDYLGTLAECRVLFGLRVYAYCLMTNHVHLIVDPRDDPASISALMKRLAGRHSRRVNAERGTSGSLWEGRFKCSVIDTDRYLLTCGRYVDQNPVRAGIVATPRDYPWSSYCARAGLAANPIIDPDPALEALSPNASRRAEIYRSMAEVPVLTTELDRIREAAEHNRVTGSDHFARSLSHPSGVPIMAERQQRRWRRRPPDAESPT
jgi:putative transposase